MVVVTFSGLPLVGGMVTWGRTDWILLATKTSLTSEAIRLDFPVPSSPQTQIRTAAFGQPGHFQIAEKGEPQGFVPVVIFWRVG